MVDPRDLKSNTLLALAGNAARREIVTMLAQPQKNLLGVLNARVAQMSHPQFHVDQWVKQIESEAW
jgi:hypothetical protein